MTINITEATESGNGIVESMAETGRMAAAQVCVCRCGAVWEGRAGRQRREGSCRVGTGWLVTNEGRKMVLKARAAQQVAHKTSLLSLPPPSSWECQQRSKSKGTQMWEK